MLTIFNFPKKLIKLLSSNVSPGEVASGFCLGMFFGFIPLNGPMAIFLFIGFFVFKINRLAVALVIPLFKLFYVLGVSTVADTLGGYLLIDLGYLASFWGTLIHMPVFALMDLSNTLVCGGLALSAVLSLPVFFVSRKGIIIFRSKYLEKMKDSKVYKFFIKIPLVKKILSITKVV